MTINDFENSIGIEFSDKSLIETVFTHRSYLNEHRSLDIEHNERLEFLGDAVLELCTTEYLYKTFPDKAEGEMTNWRSALVKGESLSAEAKRLGMNELLKTSRGESKNTGKARDLLLANALEALIGCIYLDKGYEASYSFVEKNVVYKLPDILKKGLYYDPKSKFQEMSQDQLGITPTYEMISESGPDHAKIFVMGAYINNEKVGEGQGASKQRAQSEAASNALENWQSITNLFKK
ncbi:MAG: Ribonuclease 3 [bacterium ADurb.Bin212]|nr:MAG: Ribonuclease 3 [bacterium ADurb.Bin212]